MGLASIRPHPLAHLLTPEPDGRKAHPY